MNTSLRTLDPLWLAVGCGLVLRLVYLWWLLPGYGGEDATGYLSTAASLVQSGDYLPSKHLPILIPPLYPLLMAALMVVTGDYATMALQAVNLVAGVATIVMAGRMARSLSGSARVGTIAAWLVALHPGFILYTGSIATEVLYQPLLLASLWCCVRSVQQTPPPSPVVIGVLIGITGLLRPAGLLPFAATFSLLHLLDFRRPLLHRARQVVIAGVFALATIAPWSVFISLRNDEPLFLTDASGHNFWDGHHRLNQAAIASDDPVERQLLSNGKSRDRQLLLQSARQQGLGRRALSKLFWDDAWQHMGNGNPSMFSHTLSNFRQLWRPWPDPIAYGPLLSVGVGAPLGVLIALGLLGLVRFGTTPQYRTTALACSSMIVVFTLVSAFYVSVMRYRIGHVDVLLALWAPLGLDWLLTRWRHLRSGAGVATR